MVHVGDAGGVVDAASLERLFGHGQDPRSGVPLGRAFAPGDELAKQLTPGQLVMLAALNGFISGRKS